MEPVDPEKPSGLLETEAKLRRNEYSFAKADGNVFQRLLWKLFEPPPFLDKRQPSASVEANIISRFFLSWCFNVIWRATRRPLDINDINLLDPRREASIKVHQFNHLLQKYSSPECSSRFPMIRAILGTYRRQFIVATISDVTGNYIELLSSVLLYYFGQYFYHAYYYTGADRNARFPFWIGAVYTLGYTLMICTTCILRAHSVYQASLVGGEVRTMLTSSMYAKAMRISRTAVRASAVKDLKRNEKKAQKKNDTKSEKHQVPSDGESELDKNSQSDEASPFWTESTIMTTMSVDTERIEQFISYSTRVCALPPVLPPFIVLSWVYVGWPGIVGAGLFSLVPLLSIWYTSTVKIQRDKVNKLTVERASLGKDMLDGVRFLKYFAWEVRFLDRFGQKRKEEMKQLIRVLYHSILSIGLHITALRCSPLVVLVLYWQFFVPGLSLAYAIMAWQALLTLMSTVIFNLMDGLPHLAIAVASYQNVQEYLLGKEEEPGQAFEAPRNPSNGIELDQACFSWHGGNGEALDSYLHPKEDQPPPFDLQPLTLSVGKSELIAVVGSVGAGKSSLASGLMGEMRHVSGRVGLELRNGSVAYCAQIPWIQNASVKENIVFGEPWDKDRYNRVVSACALERDIEMELPQRHDTELGELGITISGGQKARIQLARTLYRSAKTVILDDPLSAVDAVTVLQIFEDAILGELGNTCRVLITHQVHVLNRCDRIVWMEAGVVRAIGTYEDLLSKEPGFASYVGHSEAKLKEEEEERQRQAKNRSQVQKNKAPENSDIINKMNLMKDEELEVESVPWALYKDLFRKSASWWYLIYLTFMLSISQIFNMGTFLVVPWWSANAFGVPAWVYILMIVISIFGHIFTWGYFWVAFQKICLTTAQLISREAMDSVFQCPQSFFDTTPMGRLQNRFTNDVNFMDTVLPLPIWSFALSAFAIVSVLGCIAAYVPIALVLFLPWLFVNIIVAFLYSGTPLALRRLTMNSTSVFMSKLGEGLKGRSTLISCGRVPYFQEQLYSSINQINSFHFIQFAATAWVEIRSSLTSFVLSLCIGILVIDQRFDLSPSLSLFVILTCTQFANYMTELFQIVPKIQNGMNAFQRLIHYREFLPNEGSRVVEGSVGASWPLDGSIHVTDAVMRYRPGLPMALKGLNLRVESGQKIGVVGRTGAGKSSLLSMLLRTVPLESGTVQISGVDTATMGLHTLRKAIAVIPQDPTLFIGDVRFNLDPDADKKNAKSEERLNAALRTVCLLRDEDSSSSEKESGPIDSHRNITLDTRVDAGGSNFSVGNRQLLALARSLVRDSRIIFIDEATSSVDPATDDLIQSTLRREFAHCTVIAIAHRIRTLVHYDRICVMDKGRVAEFDTPRALWEQEGFFRELCDASRIVEADFN